MKNYILLSMFVFISSISHAEEFRTWTGSNSKKIEARFIHFDPDKEIVTIQLKNGKENKVRLSLFSDADKEYVKNIGKTDDPFGEGTDKSNDIVHVYLSLDEYGEGAVRIERMDKPTSSDFNGTPLKLQRFPKAKASKGKDAIAQIIHNFDDLDHVENVFLSQFGNGNKRLDTGRWTFRREFRLPVTVSIDILEQKAKDCGTINLRIGALFSLAMMFNDGDSYTLEAKYKISNELIFRAESLSLNEKYEKKFRLPVPNARITDRSRFEVEQGKIKSINDAHTFLSKVQITGRLSPWIQIGTNNPNDAPPFVKFISPKFAEESGIEKGDIIRSINGKTPENGKEMFRLFAECPLGEDITVKIERRGKEMEFKIKTDQ